MYYTTRSLGAVAKVAPPASLLKPGYEWYPIFQKTAAGADIPTYQASYCPSPAPFGCTVYQGFAWGQIQSTPSEFAAQPTSPTQAQILEYCQKALASWMQQNPGYSMCLTSAEDAHKYASLCGSVAYGSLTADAANAQWLAYADARCKSKCLEAYDAWRNTFPEQASCVPAAEGRTVFRQNCMAVIHGKRSPERAAQKWKDYVAQKCAEKGLPPPPPTSTSPSPVPPSPPPAGSTTPLPPDEAYSEPPEDYAPPSGSVDIPAEEGRQWPPSPDEEPMEATLLRRVGPIVGIGLVLAVGLTLYRTRGKRKRKARRS